MDLNRIMSGYTHGTTRTCIIELLEEVKDVVKNLATTWCL
jgi:hypothetical protein